MIASGCACRRLGERLRGGRRREDLVAGAAQVGLQRAQDLRLVVDDEDAAGAHAGLLRDASGSASAITAPGLGALGPQPAAVRLGEAARDREPEPGAAVCARCRAALERLEDPLELGGGEPGP